MTCKTTRPRFARNVLAVSIAAIGFATAPLALAEAEIELGLSHVSNGSGAFGNYNGLNESGVYGIAGIQMRRRGTDATYFEIEGRNLGLKSRSLNIGGGQQGNFGLKLDYIEIPKLESDSYQTPYLGAGSTRLTQPASVTDGANPAGMAGLAASMRPFEVGTNRKVLGLGLTKILAGGWDLAFNIKRDTKDGTKLRAAMIQTGTGGTRGSVILPEVIDYTTDQVDAIARYDGGKLQLQFGYYGSFYNNANAAMTWDNLYTGSGNTTGSYHLAPDNQFHQINASGGYVVSPTTRLAGNLSLGRMTQNESFLPYSTGGSMPATASLNGKVNTTHASLKLTSRLMPALNLTAGYKYDDRDNKTPVNQYNYITADRDAGGTGSATNALRRWNTPTSSTSHKAYADLEYQLAKATKLKLGYDYHKVSHTHEPTTQDVEQTVKAEVKQKFTDTASGGLAYSYSDRNADAYRGDAPLAATYTPGYLATLVGASGKTYPWLEAPPLRKYFLDDRKRDKLRMYASVAPTDSLDLHFGLDYRQDKHPEADAGFGLSKVNSWAANFDASQRFTSAITGHVFATLEEYSTDQKGANITTAAIATAAETNTVADASRWTVSIRDRIFTLGLGLRVKPSGKYEWGGDLIHASSNGATSFAAGSAVSNGPLPDLITRRNRLELFGRYQVQKDLSIKLQYIYERYHSTDWGYDSPLTLTSSANVVGTNQASPKYEAHVIGISALYRFR
ncbi:MAG: MtrB/PioB family decaheme-associated outer membrane protein [Burkholderiales bacterium]|nr:MtrB/PioB family decaheme-associated outer membrane protein [Burkholderiales bacterium]